MYWLLWLICMNMSKKRSKNYLGWHGRLNHRIITEINSDLLRYYYHEHGGKFIAGAFLVEIYESKYGISYHGYSTELTYELHVAQSTRGIYILVTEYGKENVNTRKEG